jgi:hypothetical protein
MNKQPDSYPATTQKKIEDNSKNQDCCLQKRRQTRFEKLKVPPIGEERNDLFNEIDWQNQGKAKPTKKIFWT